MDWRAHIHVDPSIASGKPVIRGTRLTVDFVFRLLANGWTHEQVIENYPQLTAEDLQACYGFVTECLGEESFLPARAG